MLGLCGFQVGQDGGGRRGVANAWERLPRDRPGGAKVFLQRIGAGDASVPQLRRLRVPTELVKSDRFDVLGGWILLAVEYEIRSQVFL